MEQVNERWEMIKCSSCEYRNKNWNECRYGLFDIPPIQFKYNKKFMSLMGDWGGKIPLDDPSVIKKDLNSFCPMNLKVEEKVKKVVKKDCLWVSVDNESNTFEASCNHQEFTFTTGTVLENGFKFCPYCGKTIKQKLVK